MDVWCSAHQQPMETNMNKLTKTQRTLLETAANHPEGSIILPDNIKGGAAIKVINGLISKDLAAKDDDGAMHITDTGYQAIGQEPPKPDVKEEPKAEIKPARKIRQNTKQAKVIEMLKRPEGATIEQIANKTTWKQHTVRGFLAGTIKKKLGLELITNKHRVVGPNQIGSSRSFTTYHLSG